MAARTIGGTTEDGVKWGIEGGFDSHLRGKDGNMLMQRVSGSFWMPVSDIMNIEPVDGIDVVSTIDIDMQDVAESALRQQLIRGNALWGTVVLMEVATGEVRAIANLSRRSPGVYVEDYNYAIGRAQDPGSTFKLASLLALLEDARFPLTKTYDTEGGRALVRGRYIRDDHPEGELTLQQIFERSSNIGFAKAIDEAYSSNPDRFINFLSKLGLTEALDLQIGGSAKPIINRPGGGGWDGLTLTQMAYGYALTITPLHTLTLYNAVANNGRMVRPKFVKALSSYGETTTVYNTEVMNPAICSQPTLRMVRESLQGVVDEGTAQLLRNP
jgi:cell division protein FtsI (penicillin-binding protein 3)